MEMIRLDRVTFCYREIPVLKEADLLMEQGDYVVLTGENGSGKSTLLKLILGERKPQKGQIRLLQKEILQALKEGKVGYVPQNSISQNASFPATVQEVMRTGLYRKVSRFQVGRERQICLDMLERLGMAETFHKKIGELSGGQQQRVMLARAMAGDPKLLILDEPTAGVDAVSVETLYRLLEEWNKEGLTILLVTHDDSAECKGATKILRMKQGRITEV